MRMLETAVWGTYYNVQINLSDVKDEEFKKKVRKKISNYSFRNGLSIALLPLRGPSKICSR